MKLIFHIPSNSLLETYSQIRQCLCPQDQIIFEAMVEATQDRRRPFELPSTPDEFPQKHEEIIGQLRSHVLGGREIAMRLMEGIGSRVLTAGGVVGVSAAEIVDKMLFKTSSSNVVVRLNQDLRWIVEWTIPYPIQGTNEVGMVFLEIQAAAWGEVVPAYVVEYVNSAIHSYHQGMSTAAIALLSIAVEATLRDVLETRGYTFSRGASPVDVYEYAIADVGVSGTSYTVTFREPMPREPAQFLQSIGDKSSGEIKIKRVVNWRDPNQTNLRVKVPPSLVDHWSTDRVLQPAQKRVNGLGEAFDIARNQEKILLVEDLPTDLDEVIKVVRNNLVHLSGQALSTPLKTIDPAGSTTLGDFLGNPIMVYDLLTDVPRLINRQYVRLRAAGHLAQ